MENKLKTCVKPQFASEKARIPTGPLWKVKKSACGKVCVKSGKHGKKAKKVQFSTRGATKVLHCGKAETVISVRNIKNHIFGTSGKYFSTFRQQIFDRIEGVFQNKKSGKRAKKYTVSQKKPKIKVFHIFHTPYYYDY